MKGQVYSATGVEARELVQDSVAGCSILVRSGWGPDKGVLAEWGPTYRRMAHLLGPGHTVLDIGANIGMFSVVALAKGADKVICYEPEPGAFSVLRANMGGRLRTRATLVQAAVGAKHGGTISLAVPSSGNATAASTYFPPARGRQLLSVPLHSLAHALRTYKPTLLKFDCEGEELNFLDGRTLPKHVRVVSGELHREGGNEEKCASVIESFAGWQAVHAPASYSFSRCWTVAWKR